ncbi:hypothetical protein KUTeg_015561 [Tegillarca granosa]|uniref:C1q domain-containing protein n=1 Tax=Tegillarca granosa TaxID=220873 RepID=A0ABQ9ETI7_TEGGR|nr:hypothetical protein KUTeg_015361 [Tegillarca granosa]KAJ8307477.1 hypothetical protein KUTeg_015561 [Tegillarca granosa]
MIFALLFVTATLFDGCGEEGKYSFFATLKADLVNPNVGDKVKFDNVITNNGSAYNMNTGIFIAKATGIYYFEFVANGPYHQDDHILHLALKKNTQTIGYVYIDHDRQYWRHGTTSAVVNLNVGDQVYVQVFAAYGQRVLGGSNHVISPASHSQFLGYLI